MIKILGNEGTTIKYRCSCGIEGQCMVKPMASEGTFIVDVRCPLCEDLQRVKLTTGEDDITNLSWACVIKNEITKYFVGKGN